MLDTPVYKLLTLKNVIVFAVAVMFTAFACANKDITVMLFASVVIACSLNPVVNLLCQKKMNRHLAAGIVLVTFLLIICLFLIPVVIISASQIGVIADNFPQYLDNMDDFLTNSQFLHKFGIDKDVLPDYTDTMYQHAGELMGGAATFLGNIGSALAYFLVSLVFTYFFMADTKIIKSAFIRLFPKSVRQKTEEIISIIADKIGGYVIAQLYAIISVGIVMSIGLALFKVEYALTLGFITAVLDIIPVVGPGIALIIGIVTVSGTGWSKIIAVIVSFTAAQIIENNVVRPYAFGKLLNIHPILVFAFLFIGAKFFGVAGALFAPAIAATVCVLIEELYIKNIE